jgi:MFS transporter, PCFT/HCP family, solute carrier family 46 (folate transporter), member 1
MESSLETIVIKEKSKKHHLKLPALEFALFLLFFGWYLSHSIITNQILKQTCLYKYEYSFIICTNLDDRNATAEVEQEIQPYVAKILMTIMIFNSIVPTVLSLFLGPWSDKYGRKKVINSIFIGFTISMGWIMTVSGLSDYVQTNNPWNYLFAQFPFMLVGGWPTLIIVILCYFTDKTTEEERSTRLTIFEITIFIGLFIAIASSSFILQLTNPTFVFFISFVCISTGTLIEVFFVEESLIQMENVGIVQQYKDIFSLTRVKELCKAFVQARTSRNRETLWLLTIILVCVNFTSHGSNTVFYLFTRQHFGWTLQDVTIYESCSMLFMIAGSIFGLVVLKKLLKLSDFSMSIISLTSLAFDALIKTFSTQSFELYVASAFALFKLVSGPMLRSVMSTLISKDDVSKIYSITTSLEAISGLGAAPLYTATYAATLITFPAAFNLITFSTLALTLVLAYFISRWLKNKNEKKTLDTRL